MPQANWLRTFVEATGQNQLTNRVLVRSLHDAERACDTNHCKRMEVVLEVLLLRTYLQGCQVTVGTDYEALSWMLNLPD